MCNSCNSKVNHSYQSNYGTKMLNSNCNCNIKYEVQIDCHPCKKHHDGPSHRQCTKPWYKTCKKRCLPNCPPPYNPYNPCKPIPIIKKRPLCYPPRCQPYHYNETINWL